MRSLTSFFFLAAVTCATFERVNWNLAGAVNISEIWSALFIVCYLILSRPRVPETTAVLLGFCAVFALVYLIGYFNLDSQQGEAQFVKGFITTVHHLIFLAVAVAWIWRRGLAYYWRTLTWFVGGIVANSVYGIIDLLGARSGVNLDSLFLNPITGGASKINRYGAIQGASVYRTTGMSGDPNHLAIFIIVPLLILTPLYLRLERQHRLKGRLGLLIAFLLLVEISTLSRSGLLGLAVGGVILALPYWGYLASRTFLGPLAAALVVLAAVVVSRLHYFEVILLSRIQTKGGSDSTHLHVYSFIPMVLRSHPTFGLGLNNFSILYEQVTGKTNWGPHSFYVSLLVETGLVGTAVYAIFLGWVFTRLAAGRALGRALSLAGDPLARRVRPLAWGWTAALVGTLASNAFYLTMTFFYFYVVLALVLTLPLVFARQAVQAAPALGAREAGPPLSLRTAPAVP